MVASIPHAKAIGADVMRVVGSSRCSGTNPTGRKSGPCQNVQEAVKVAKDTGVKMAVENHIDFTADEILQLLDDVGSEYLGLNFDTGNFLRLLDDPSRGWKSLLRLSGDPCQGSDAG